MKLLDREEQLEKEPVLEQERTLEEQLAEITREVGPRREAARPVVTGHRFGRRSWLVVALVVAAIAAIAIAVMTTGGDETATEPDATTSTPAAVEINNYPFTDDEITLMQLARAGYIPKEAVDWELMELKGLVQKGYVPAESLRPLLPPVKPLHTAAELELLQLVRTNQIPREAVDWQRMELIDLVAQGHVPREALVDLGRPLLPPGAQRLPVEANNEVLALYRENQVPRDAVDWQLLDLVDLVNMRHVPPESLYTTG